MKYQDELINNKRRVIFTYNYLNKCIFDIRWLKISKFL
jgi:hypothetical protein